MKDLLGQLPSIKPKGQVTYWGNTLGAALPYVIYKLLQDAARPVVLVVANSAARDALLTQIEHLLDEDFPIYTFMDWEILPYDRFSPHEDIIAERIRALHALSAGKPGLYLTTVATAAHVLCPKSHIEQRCLELTVGQPLSLDKTPEALVRQGYLHVQEVQNSGEFSVRGGILDLFPVGLEQPVRVELFDNDITSLRHFEPQSQRSTQKLEHVSLLPAKEYPCDNTQIAAFKTRWVETFSRIPDTCPIYHALSEKNHPPGLEYYIPLFFETQSTLWDYLPESTLLITTDGLEHALNRFMTDVQDRYEQLRHDIDRPILPPKSLFIPLDKMFSAFKRFERIALSEHPIESTHAISFGIEALPEMSIDNHHRHPLHKLRRYIDLNPAAHIILCAQTLGRRQSLQDILNRENIPTHLTHTLDEAVASPKTQTVHLCVMPIETGVFFKPSNVALFSESQLYGRSVPQRRRRQSKQLDDAHQVRDLIELEIGDAVVHIEHGIGRYRGLQHMRIGDMDNEFMLIEYANDDKIYVPITALDQIGRYSGAQVDVVPLSKLGSDQWEKARRKAAEKIRDVAAELLDIHARRAAQQGYAFERDQDSYEAFAREFPFEETFDQLRAIDETLKDMASDKPMDRLVCGDVGFGKTEVAMRAAFLAVTGGKQVAILVPTTLLAQQHFENFKDRFAGWPVNIAIVSRFQAGKATTETLNNTAAGQTDILIGTHKILQDTVSFKNLGLIIIDEEHRFGVRQKEKLKALRASVDILTLTATPIPRTLNLALSGIRDLSIIATPPAKRLSIKTFVQESSPSVIREAVLRELMRGGQVYYLHNDVDSIGLTAEKITEIVPEAVVRYAHGQMRERELEQIMSDFYHQRFNVLVCTTIIETGIDIPTANTILMDRADKLGLAQLHQLRGRVGRSHHQAYAYCFTPPVKSLTPNAKKRFEAFATLEDLGAGFSLASHDLEIRGAGDFLGDGQSGHVQAIGYTLYLSMLENAVAALKKGKPVDLDAPIQLFAQIDCSVPALIPDQYMPDVDMRLLFYKRIANARDDRALDRIQVELIDRFGLIPTPLSTLFQVTKMKLLAQPLGIKKIEANAQRLKFCFHEEPKINIGKLLNMIQIFPRRYKLKSTQELVVIDDFSNVEKRFETLEETLQMMTP